MKLSLLKKHLFIYLLLFQISHSMQVENQSQPEIKACYSISNLIECDIKPFIITFLKKPQNLPKSQNSRILKSIPQWLMQKYHPLLYQPFFIIEYTPEKLIGDPTTILQALTKCKQHHDRWMVENGLSIYKTKRDSTAEPSVSKNTHDIDQYHLKIAALQLLCPIFLLSECSTLQSYSGSAPCFFSRNSHPNFRHSYEETVSNALLEQLKTKKDAVQYVSFGAGGLFQDLVILTKALSQNPASNLEVHIIENEYTLFSYSHSQLKLDNKIDDQDIDLLSIKKTLCNITPSNFSVTSSTDDDEILFETLALRYHYIKTIYKQFNGWFQTHFPKTQFSLYLHGNVDNYYAYMNQNKDLAADIIVTADIQDAQSQSLHAQTLYQDLCQQALRKNKTMKNFFLFKQSTADLLSDHSDENTSAYICSYQLERTDKTNIEHFDLDGSYYSYKIEIPK